MRAEIGLFVGMTPNAPRAFDWGAQQEQAYERARRGDLEGFRTTAIFPTDQVVRGV